MNVAFGIGYTMSSSVAVGFPYWKNFTTAVALTSVPAIIILAFLPQSPRWAYANDRPNDGWQILKGLAWRMNATLPDDLNDKIKEIRVGDKDASKTLTIIDVLKSSHLRSNTFLIGFAFLAVTIAYYGLAYNAAALPGDLYVNNAINGVADTFASLLLMFSMPYIGRKLLTSSTFIFEGTVCIICAVLLEMSDGKQAITEAAQWLSFIGKFFVSGSFG